MKKILTIMIALVAFAWIADAQINIKKSDVDKAKELTTLSMSWSWIYQQGDNYYIVMKSDNRFDDRYWLNIGRTKDECIDGLKSLIELSETIGEDDRYDIDNGDGEIFDVTQYYALGMTGLRFHGKGYAGTAYILTSNLNKAMKWVQKNVQ